MNLDDLDVCIEQAYLLLGRLNLALSQACIDRIYEREDEDEKLDELEDVKDAILAISEILGSDGIHCTLEDVEIGLKIYEHLDK